MRKVFLFMMVSLDGYFEGPNQELDWHNVDEEFNQFAQDQIAEADTMIFGRVTYELMASYWPNEDAKSDDPEIAKLMNSYPKIVFSHDDIKVDWENTTLLKDIEELRKLKTQPGKDIVVFGSNNLCVSLIKAGLLNEARIMVAPVVLGKGHTLFSGLNEKLALKLEKTREFKNGNVLLYYLPADAT